MQLPLRFHGSTFDPLLDGARLGRQLKAVVELMEDGRWRTLAEIERETGHPQASVSARLRQMRSLGITVERRRRKPGAGTWEYRAGGNDGR